MATVGSFRQLLKSMIVYSKVIGVEMWTAPGKFLPASYYLSIQMAIYLISTIFTLSKYRDDPLHMMKVLITLGTAVQLYIKFFIGHSRANYVKQLSIEIEQDVLQRYEHGTAEEVAVLRHTGRILWAIFRFMSVTVSTASAGFGLYPLFAYYAKGVLMPLFLYELPLYDSSTTMGYVVNMVFQVNLLVIGTMGEILSNFLYFMYAMYAMAKADILIVHLGELEAVLIAHNEENENHSKLRNKWLQCMNDHQQATKFLNVIEHIFGLVCLAQVVMGVFTLCDGMLLVVLTDWYPTYCFLLVMFIELSIYFVIGNLVELKIDEMYSKIISISWYKLPIKEQKEFGFLMCRQQRPMLLTAYGFFPMNFEAYMRVLKGLYQFFVMLMQYVG